MDAQESGPLWLWIQVLLWVWVLPLVLGRVVLAFLPPGRPGGHRPLQLPGTLAATLVCGHGFGLAWSRWVGLVPGADAPGSGLWLIAAALLVVRLATLPGGFVPGPAGARPPSGRASLALRWAAALSIVARVVVARLELGLDPGRILLLFDGMYALLLLASVFAIDHALLEADSDEGERSLVWVILGGLVWLADPRLLTNDQVLSATFALSAAASFLVGWWRRADRRAAVLCALALALEIASAPRLWWLGAAGMVALVAGTSAGGRRLVAKASLLSLTALVLPIVLQRPLAPEEDLARLGLGATSAWGPAALLPIVAAPLLVLAFGLLLAWGRPRPRPA